MALSKDDLTVFEGTARISDQRIFEALGFSTIGNLRRLIRRRKDELEDFGRIFILEDKKSGRGRSSIHYFLNEHQATAICLWAETAKAREARITIVKVFTAWRQGETLPTPQSMPPRSAFAELAERRIAITALEGTANAREVDPKLIGHLSVWSSNLRPKWWWDLPVREFATSLHGTMTQAAALALCIEEFGKERAPSRSSLNRYWIKLDSAFGPNDTHAVRRLRRGREK